MKIVLNVLLAVCIVGFLGCNEQNKDPRVNNREQVRSDDLGNNALFRPVANAFSALIGEGIEITDVQKRINQGGFAEIFILGYNKSPQKKTFEVKVEWVDSDGMMIDTQTTAWQMVSAMGHSNFSYKSVAPRTEAVDFRIDTRKIRK